MPQQKSLFSICEVLYGPFCLGLLQLVDSLMRTEEEIRVFLQCSPHLEIVQEIAAEPLQNVQRVLRQQDEVTTILSLLNTLAEYPPQLVELQLEEPQDFILQSPPLRPYRVTQDSQLLLLNAPTSFLPQLEAEPPVYGAEQIEVLEEHDPDLDHQTRLVTTNLHRRREETVHLPQEEERPRLRDRLLRRLFSQEPEHRHRHRQEDLRLVGPDRHHHRHQEPPS